MHLHNVKVLGSFSRSRNLRWVPVLNRWGKREGKTKTSINRQTTIYGYTGQSYLSLFIFKMFHYKGKVFTIVTNHPKEEFREHTVMPFTRFIRYTNKSSLVLGQKTKGVRVFRLNEFDTIVGYHEGNNLRLTILEIKEYSKLDWMMVYAATPRSRRIMSYNNLRPYVANGLYIIPPNISKYVLNYYTTVYEKGAM